jgi:hypothetical protein
VEFSGRSHDPPRRFVIARMNARLLPALAVTGALAAAAPAAASAAVIAGGSFARTAPFIDGTLYAFECHAAGPSPPRR